MAPRSVPPLTSRTGLVRAYAFTPGEPPAEIQLWSSGDNATDYGVHRWTARSAKIVSDEYARRGNPLQIDVEHNASAEEKAKAKQDDPPITGGYARLEIRAGVPWLVFDWSALAIEQIRTRQRLFLSPEYAVDTNTNEIVRLVRVSLVGDPGTHHAKMLASAAATQRIAAKRGNMDPKLIGEALDALQAGDSEKALGILKSMIAQAAGGGAAPPADDPAIPAAAGAPPPPPAPSDAGAPPADKKDKVMPAAPSATAAPVAAASAAAQPAANPLEQRLDAIERDQLLKDNAHRIKDETIRAWAARQPLAVVREFVAALPAAPATTKAAAPTRGAGQGGPASALPPKEKEELDARMGRAAAKPAIERKGTDMVFRAMTREQAVAHVAAKAKEGAK